MKKFFGFLWEFFTAPPLGPIPPRRQKTIGKAVKGTSTLMTLGERDSKGYCTLFVEGEETKVKLLTFTSEEIDRLQKIGQEIRDKEDEENKKS